MKKVFSLLISNLILAIVFANKVLAQDNFGVNELSNGGVALGTRSMQDVVANIINIFLGFLGTLATILLLYAGYLWMTSGGNAQKVAKAKLLISSALIGLVIILSAYAISRFVLQQLYDVTGVVPATVTCTLDSQCAPNCCNSNICGSCSTIPTSCTAPPAANDPRICSLSEGSGQIGSGFWVRGWHFDVNPTDNDPGILGKVTINGVDAEIIECAGNTLWYDDKVKIKVPDSLLPGTYPVVLTNDADIATDVTYPIEIFNFTVLPGTSAVNIDCLVPDEGPAGVVTNVTIIGNGFDTEDTLTMNGWLAGTEVLLNNANLNITSWSDLQIDMSVPTNALTSDIEVTVGLDSDTEKFTVTCALDTDCDSGCCYNNVSCMPLVFCDGSAVIPTVDIPVIDDISPENGEEETLITISGYNFGNTPGEVIFRETAGDFPGLPPSDFNGVCVDTWTDNYIIISVPGGTGTNESLSITVTQAAIEGGESSYELADGFERNNTVRPGICSLSETEGVFGETITAEGVNFTATDTAYFDTMASYITTVASSNSASTQIPNIYGNLPVTMVSSAGDASNQFPFLAIVASGGDPIITELSPDSGPTDSYVTIMGSGFGDETGVVYFDVDNDLTILGEQGGIDFPVQCGDYWFDDHIIIKVPTALAVGDYFVRVQRSSDSVFSNDFDDFTVDTTLAGPQICAIVPDNGPIGLLGGVNVFGENLGSNNIVNFATFYESRDTTYTLWNPNQVLGIEVPVGASAGPVTVTNSDGNESNALPFDVGACNADTQCDMAGGEECCAEGYCSTSCTDDLNECSYSWEVGTEDEAFGLHYNYDCETDLQSPSPWADEHPSGTGPSSLDAFIDTNISALFTRDVEDSDLVVANVIVRECNTGGPTLVTTDCAAVGIAEDDLILDILNSNTNREGFTFNPAANLLADTWYRVDLGTFETAVGDDTWTNPDTWYFKTRADDLLCEVSNVMVTPQPSSSNIYVGQEKNFSASPIAANCNICGGEYNWHWELDHNLGSPSDYASYIPIDNTAVNHGFTRLTGGLEATQFIPLPDDNYISIIATTTSNGLDVIGDTQSMILAPVLRVENYAPSCNDSCGNAVIFAEFNTELQASGVSQFGVHHCTGVLPNVCDTYDPISMTASIDILSDPYKIQINESSDLSGTLDNGESYIVIAAADIVNIYGYQLGTDFSWTFTVGDENCEMTSADISPDNYTAYSLSPITYRGYAMADGGSCGAEAIICDTCDYAWSSSDTNIAIIEPGGIGEDVVLATPLLNTVIPPIDIHLTIDGSYGTESDDTPLIIDVASVGPVGPTALAVSSYWPNCGACTESQASVLFNSDLNGATVDDINIIIHNNSTGFDDPIVILPIVGDRRVIIDHGPFNFGDEYQIEVNTLVENTDGDTLDFAWISPPIVIENAACLADAAWVDPVTATAGASDSVNYFAVPTHTSATCGATPVTCPTCTYTWLDNTLGGSGAITQDSIFQTLATVVDGASDMVSVLVDRGGVGLPVTDGDLTIAIVPGGTVEIINYYPPLWATPAVPVCTNIAPNFEFDTSSGDLDKNSVRAQFKLYEHDDVAGVWDEVTGNIQFIEDAGITTAYFHPENGFLSDDTTHRFFFEDPDQVVSTDSIVVEYDLLALGLWIPGLASFPNSLGMQFNTTAEPCSVHSVEIDYNEGDELFSCIEDDCEGDWGGAVGNQHEYRSIVRDIRNTVLSASAMDYTWMSLATDIFSPDMSDTSDILATAHSNGITNLSLEVVLVSEPTNIVTTSEPLEVNTCEVPWPSLSDYPWDSENGLNFSTYYCENYDASLPADLPSIDIPHTVTPQDTNVLHEFITTINYGIADSGQQNPYLGSLAYNNEEPKEIEKSWNNKLSSLFVTEKVNSAGTCPPVQPSNFIGVYDDSIAGFNFTWDIDFLPGVETHSGYQLYVDGVRESLNVYPRTIREFYYPATEAGGVHTYKIAACNISECSSDCADAVAAAPEIVVNLPARTCPPAQPTNLTGVYIPATDRVVLNWDIDFLPGVIGHTTWAFLQNGINGSGYSRQIRTFGHSSPPPGINTYKWNACNSICGDAADCRTYPSATISVLVPAGPPLICPPVQPNGLTAEYIPATSSTQLNWSVASSATYLEPDHFLIEVDNPDGTTESNYLMNPTITDFDTNMTFTPVDEDENYTYTLSGCNIGCTPNCPPAAPTITVGPSVAGSAIDIIGFRVMKNEGHLSVSEWYSKMFPTAEDAGTLMQVDGYEALQVGGTVYVAATNIYDPGNALYTNIYIIAHNIGARAKTLDIYGQMLDNFKLNTNLTEAPNLCNDDPTITCSSDFDCPTGTCDSSDLKLRRDTKRLSDLVSIDNAILDYGQSNKACLNNSLISCEEDGDCPSGSCVPYYPSLNAGSYLDGLSNSSWPSWQGTFSSAIGMPAPSDPIGLFNACGEGTSFPGYDVDTCWDETALDFICPTNSLVYMYNVNGFGQTYDLGAQFEYDSIAPIPPTITFANLAGDAITIDRDPDYCTGVSINAPGLTALPYCGNGLMDPGEECDSEFWNFACSENPDGTPTILGSGGTNGWWDEQTIGCYPPGTIDPITGALIECTWYIPDPEFTAAQCGGYCGDTILQSYYESCDVGIMPSDYACKSGPATLCSDGCQVMCNDDGDYLAALCGDGIWAEEIEDCDPSADPNGLANWDCTENGNIACSNSCEYTCTTGVPYEGVCGDGFNNEFGYCSVDCPDCLGVHTIALLMPACQFAGGIIVQHDPINLYPEECDYLYYEIPLPEEAGVNRNYGCTESCEMDGNYCGDGELQYDFQEICDYANYSTPEPLASDKYNQYLCRDNVSGTTDINGIEYGACTATLGGYCGDGFIDIDGYCSIDCPACEGLTGLARLQACAAIAGSYVYYDWDTDPNTIDPAEECDPGTPWDGIAPSPAMPSTIASAIDNQYFCDVDCVGTIGGYCGDSTVQSVAAGYEICDGEDYPDRPSPADSNTNNTYNCSDNCIDTIPGVDGGYFCGDGYVNEPYYEMCDWGSNPVASYPYPRGTDRSIFSDEMNQYVCEDCVTLGGYCGDGVIDGECSVSCSEDYGSGFTSPYGCSELQCNTEGGVFIEQYEQCDPGFDPAESLVKDIDIVYLFDMSGSMGGDATALCGATQEVAEILALPENDDINYRITIFILDDVLGSGTAVSNALYTNCPLHQQAASFPYVRYLAFYDEATNDVDGTTLDSICPGQIEDWGYAIKRVAEDYNWLPNHSRIVVPVSDEHASCGDSGDSNNDDYDDPANFDILIDAVTACNLADPKVFINPVLLNDPLLSAIGQDIADDTGGLFTDSTLDWAVQTMHVINATFCDGNGDGHVDCSVPTP